MKKVCIDINSVVPLYLHGYVRGIGRTTLELVQSLACIENLPFEVVLYSQNMKGIGCYNLNLPFKKKHLYYPHRPNFNRIFRLFPVKETFTRCDLMHVQNYEDVFSPSKTVVTLHDALFMKMQEKQFNHVEMVLKVPPFIRKCKTVITCSHHSKKDIVETMDVSPEKIHVIPWGIQHDVFYPDPDPSYIEEKFGLVAPYFLSVSCNDERKNTPRLIDAYIRLSKNHPTNKLCLVWDAPSYILEQIKQEGMEHRICFLKGINDDDLRKVYSCATATVFPSLYEGFGLPVLESMACGTPVITSNNSSLPEVGSTIAIYIDPLDIHSIEYAMSLFENNQIIYDEAAKQGIQWASQFTWDTCGRATAAVYEKYLF